MNVALRPVRERSVVRELGLIRRIVAGQNVVRWRRKMRSKTLDLFVGHRCRSAALMRPLLFDIPREHFGCSVLDEDLDARLVFVVATAIAVVDAKDRVEIVENFGGGEKWADHV